MPDADEFQFVGTRFNLFKVCEAMGIKVYDTSLPQNFVDEVREETGQNIYGLVVWSYDKYRTFGGPVPVCEEGYRILSEWIIKRGVSR